MSSRRSTDRPTGSPTLSDYLPIREVVRRLNLESIPYARRMIDRGRLRAIDWYGETLVELASVQAVEADIAKTNDSAGMSVDGRTVCTTKEAADIYGCTTGRIRQLASSGGLWSRHVSPKTLVFDLEEVRRKAAIVFPNGGGRRRAPKVPIVASAGSAGPRRKTLGGRRVCTAEEAARILGVSRQRIHQLGTAGKVWTALDEHGFRVFDLDAVEALAKARGKG